MMLWLQCLSLGALLCATMSATWGMSLPEQLSRVKRQSGDDCAQADIVMVLDSSGSIGIDNWYKVLNFTKTVVDSFPVGDLGIRLGVLSYGNRATIAFHLNAFDNADDMKDAIDTIVWKDEATNTSGGIRQMYSAMFTKENGDRPNIPNIGIVITDGESNRDQNLTVPEADLARDNDIMMFALGIGSEVNQEELVGIGNKPLESSNISYVFNAESFDALNMISIQLVAAACEAVAACKIDSDIVFIMDSSGSVGEDNFQTMKQFATGVLENVNVSPDESHIGLVTFSDDAVIEFGLQTGIDSRAAVSRLMNAVKFRRGTTNTAAAIKKAREEIFTKDGDRSDYRDIIVLVTDGGSNDYDATIKEAMLARQAGIDIVVVGIGGWLNERELMEIATDPDEANVILVPTIDQVATVADLLKNALCNDIDECAGEPCENGGTCLDGVNGYMCMCPQGSGGAKCQIKCNKPVDLVLSLDASTSMNPQNFFEIERFAKKLAMALPFDADSGVRMGVQCYATNPRPEFMLNTYSTKMDIMNAMAFQPLSGATNTGAAMAELRNVMFTPANGDREDAENVAIFVTDGHSSNRKSTFEEAVATRNEGVTVMTIGVGVQSMYDLREIEGITSDPDEVNFINAVNYTMLMELADSVLSAICNEEDDCADNPCGDGGQCQDRMGGYSCMCDMGTTGATCERNCDGQMDVVFLIDTSGSIRRNRFKIFKEFVQGLVSNMEVSPDRARVGVLTFSDDVVVHMHLSDMQSKEDVIQSVEMIEYRAGRTNTAAALRTARDEMFTEDNGDRLTVPNFAILVTDGQSTVDPELTLPEAIEARVAGMHIMVVGAEVDGDSLEVKGIASDPDEENIFVVERFDELPTMMEPVLAATCDDTDECLSSPCQNGGSCFNGLKQFVCLCQDEFSGRNCNRSCTSRQDLVFILDSSGSMEQDFSNQLELTKEIVYGLNFGGGRTQVGLLTFSDDASVRFHLNQYLDQQSILNAIAFTQAPGRTNTADALDTVATDMLTNLNGDRSGVDNVVIVMTDGNSNINPDDTIPMAADLQNMVQRVITVGIGNAVNTAELDAMATFPQTENTYSLEDESEILSVASEILDTLCT